MKSIALLLFLILFIAFFFRIYSLQSVPPSPSLDEVSIGYNAFSILKTGKDEYGYFLPILQRAYDDYRPALYMYLVVPFVWTIGLNTLSVRLPSILLSLFSIFCLFIICKRLFFLNNLNFGKDFGELVGLASAFFLAISPWHLYLSRLGHEVNAGFALFLSGIMFFLLAIDKKHQLSFIIASFVSFALSLYTYQSQKMIVPLVIALLITFFWKKIITTRKEMIIGFIIFAIVSMPIFIASISGNGLIRLKGTNAFLNAESMYRERAEQLLAAKQKGNVILEVVYNRRFVPLQIFLSNYFSHFNPSWLFLNEAAQSHKIPNTGLFFWWEVPLFLLGLFVLYKKKEKKLTFFLFLWIIISPLPAAITTDAPHAMRSYTLLPPALIIVGIGAIYLYRVIYADKSVTPKYTLSILGMFLLFSSLISVWINYFYVFPKTQSESFQYALSKSLPYIIANEERYNHIILSNKDNLYQSYMFYLFASRYDPHKYQSLGGTKSGGFAEEHNLGKYIFEEIKSVDQKKTLYVGNPSEFPNEYGIKSFKYLDGVEGIRIIER